MTQVPIGPGTGLAPSDRGCACLSRVPHPPRHFDCPHITKSGGKSRGEGLPTDGIPLLSVPWRLEGALSIRVPTARRIAACQSLTWIRERHESHLQKTGAREKCHPGLHRSCRGTDINDLDSTTLPLLGYTPYHVYRASRQHLLFVSNTGRRTKRERWVITRAR